MRTSGILLWMAGGAALSGCAAHPGEWKLGVQTYTFNRFTLFESIDKAEALGLGYIEGFTWQRVSPEHEVQLLDASDEVLDALRQKLDGAGVKLTHVYSNTIGRSEEDSRRVFAFADKLGIETIVCEPPAETLPSLDEMAGEYGVRLAIHNHGQNPDRPGYVNWNPAEAVKLARGRSDRIGFCADTGHWLRSGVDPVEGLRIYGDRLISLHLKVVHAHALDAHDVPFGEGVGDVTAMLEQLHRQGFSGLIAIEYESNMDDNMADVAACIAYYNDALEAIGR